MIPIVVAAQLGLPLIDCDGMGRAFPELQMVTFNLDGIPATPMAITDEKGISASLRPLIISGRNGSPERPRLKWAPVL